MSGKTIFTLVLSFQLLAGYAEDARGPLHQHLPPSITLGAHVRHHFWLASARAGLYAANGSPIVAAIPGGASSTDVGPELDLLADIKLSRHYDIGAQWGHLFPGPFLRQYSSHDGRTFYAVFLDVHL